MSLYYLHGGENILKMFLKCMWLKYLDYILRIQDQYEASLKIWFY